jgi:hypothetical protein
LTRREGATHFARADYSGATRGGRLAERKAEDNGNRVLDHVAFGWRIARPNRCCVVDDVLPGAPSSRPGTLAIDGRVAVTVSAQVLRDIAAHAGPQKSLVVFGYAGWGAGQLDGEMRHNVWFTAPEDPKLVFDEDRAKMGSDDGARDAGFVTGKELSREHRAVWTRLVGGSTRLAQREGALR